MQLNQRDGTAQKNDGTPQRQANEPEIIPAASPAPNRANALSETLVSPKVGSSSTNPLCAFVAAARKIYFAEIPRLQIEPQATANADQRSSMARLFE
jgi:ribonuclease D